MSLPGFRSLLAVTEAGFEPVGIAVGAAAYQIMFPSGCLTPLAVGTEPVVFSGYEQALREWWQLALGRLEADAAAKGAHGVVGVSAREETTPGSFLRQLTLIGTAVRVEGGEPLARPFLSRLAMDETLKLLLGGWVPTGVAFGLAAVHVHGFGSTAWSQGSPFANTELRIPTAGMQLARDRAEYELRAALQALGGGAIAATVQLNRFPQSCGNGHGFLIEARMLATAVVRYREPVVGISGSRNLAGGRTR